MRIHPTKSLAALTIPRGPRLRLVALLVLALLAGACGARLSPAERRQAASAVLNGSSNGGSGSGTATGTGTGSTGTSTGTGSVGGTGTGTGSTGTGSTGTGSTGTASTGGTKSGSKSAAAGNCPTGGSGTGLTSTSVTVGTIASETGPVSGLFSGAVEGAEAFRAFINSQNGICGHTVNVDSADDGTNCSQNQNATQDLASKVFAFVGSFSLYDQCGAPYIQQHNIPDLHVALGPQAETPPSHFDLEPGPPGYATGMFTFYAKKYGSAVQHVGTLFPNIPSAVVKQKAFVHSAESQGWKFVYSRAGDATESDWTSDFVKMCQQDHIKIFFTPAENAANSAKMVNDESQAGCPKSLINIIPIAYDQAFVGDVGNNSEIEGLQGWNEYSLFFNPDEAQRIPELAQLQTWFARANGSKPLNLYALFAWAEGRLFQQAFENAGTTISQSSLIAALKKVTNFTANGIMAPMDPGSKTEGVHCYILWQYHNGAFERVDDPATGYRCDGEFLPLNG